MALNVFVKFTILIVITHTFILIEGALPIVTFEALRSGGFRAIIPETGNVTEFKLNAEINEKLLIRRPGRISQETNVVNGDYLVLQFSNQLKIGDVINYRVFVTKNKLGYLRDNLIWEVSELLDSYPQINKKCDVASTVVNGKHTCIGDLIFEDYFNKSVIDLSKWSFEHKIATFSGPDYVFNSYENTVETRFLKNGVLYLQPIALKEESDVRGTLNLREGCTSEIEIECFYEQASSFLLPPVKSAEMKSLINFKYGKIEIRAKLPAGDWIIPVIELQPSGKNVDNDFKKIWITYSRGNNHLKGNFNDDIGSRIMFAGPIMQPTEPERSKHVASRSSADPYYANFHLYTLEWLPGRLKFYFNSELFGDISTSSFDLEQQLILGVSVGGIHDFPDGYNSDTGTKPWSNTERNYIKQFFSSRNIWLETWNDADSALKIDFVKITAI